MPSCVALGIVEVSTHVGAGADGYPRRTRHAKHSKGRRQGQQALSTPEEAETHLATSYARRLISHYLHPCRVACGSWVACVQMRWGGGERGGHWNRREVRVPSRAARGFVVGESIDRIVPR